MVGGLCSAIRCFPTALVVSTVPRIHHQNMRTADSGKEGNINRSLKAGGSIPLFPEVYLLLMQLMVVHKMTRLYRPIFDIWFLTMGRVRNSVLEESFMFGVKLFASKTAAKKSSQQTTMVRSYHCSSLFYVLCVQYCKTSCLHSDVCNWLAVGRLFEWIGRLRNDGWELRTTTFFNPPNQG